MFLGLEGDKPGLPGYFLRRHKLDYRLWDREPETQAVPGVMAGIASVVFKRRNGVFPTGMARCRKGNDRAGPAATR